jgi:phthalate 4,5-dioxygenase reductase subunit
MSIVQTPNSDRASLSPSTELRPLCVRRKTQVARDIHAFELVAPDGAPLPSFEAGAHLPVLAPNGMLRQYSLYSDPGQLDHYGIAVKREAGGRGGSISMADELKEGDTLMAGPCANAFGLSDKARSFILVAGGIGITPMMSMVHALQADGLRPFKLYYLTRDPESTAFAKELAQLLPAHQLKIHHDHGDPTRSLDLWPVFEKPQAGAHVYCCGPRGLMDGVRDMTGHWPDSSVHFEIFGADAKARPDDQPFEVTLARSARNLRVEAGQTLLGALRDAGLYVPSSCESGTCGSCKVGLIEGVADHRDMVLLPEERDHHIMACVSRAHGGRLVLDL